MSSDPVFKALAHPGRRHLLDTLHEHSGLTLGELCEGREMRRQSVSQNIELLEAANLVSSVRDGRRKLHYLNPVPIQEIGERWIRKFEEPYLRALADVKRQAEGLRMTDEAGGTIPDYVYTTYIEATPEEVWHALTDPELTARFWGHSQRSTWAVGSEVDHVRTDGSEAVDATGKVIAADPPHRLVFGFDSPENANDPAREPSVVSFAIEADRDIVKLTMTQSNFVTAEEREANGEAWPAVIANLKTLLETGDPMPQEPWAFAAD